MCARKSRHLTLLYQGSGQHNPPHTQRNCHRTSKANAENESNNKTTVRLLRNAGGGSACIKASKMILAAHSDAGFCNKKELRRQLGGHFFLSNDDKFLPNNGATLTITTIIKGVMSSAGEAEFGALSLNSKEVAYLQQILTKMDQLQPRTPIQTNNSTVEGVVNYKIQPKRTKAKYMHFH
jgi:hypothetical protein